MVGKIYNTSLLAMEGTNCVPFTFPCKRLGSVRAGERMRVPSGQTWANQRGPGKKNSKHMHALSICFFAMFFRFAKGWQNPAHPGARYDYSPPRGNQQTPYGYSCGAAWKVWARRWRERVRLWFGYDDFNDFNLFRVNICGHRGFPGHSSSCFPDSLRDEQLLPAAPISCSEDAWQTQRTNGHANAVLMLLTCCWL